MSFYLVLNVNFRQLSTSTPCTESSDETHIHTDGLTVLSGSPYGIVFYWPLNAANPERRLLVFSDTRVQIGSTICVMENLHHGHGATSKFFGQASLWQTIFLPPSSCKSITRTLRVAEYIYVEMTGGEGTDKYLVLGIYFLDAYYLYLARKQLEGLRHRRGEVLKIRRATYEQRAYEDMIILEHIIPILLVFDRSIHDHRMANSVSAANSTLSMYEIRPQGTGLVILEWAPKVHRQICFEVEKGDSLWKILVGSRGGDDINDRLLILTGIEVQNS
ncbi:hypothetical protein K435DRAFT_795534 [Dendrothele bispora CBS 962.96]|uniref:Uncharacterized protein n=1 Tax=Dendrothele bispora (strain CBS 962.96) TaxID=1314807 RepID=A0A4S8M8Z3_DENBC|nr:hypothetical protein K435DRAFT_795534 [Dendrothele bispora CBS 962.96]